MSDATSIAAVQQMIEIFMVVTPEWMEQVDWVVPEIATDAIRIMPVGYADESGCIVAENARSRRVSGDRLATDP